MLYSVIAATSLFVAFVECGPYHKSSQRIDCGDEVVGSLQSGRTFSEYETWTFDPPEGITKIAIDTCLKQSNLESVEITILGKEGQIIEEIPAVKGGVGCGAFPGGYHVIDLSEDIASAPFTIKVGAGSKDGIFALKLECLDPKKEREYHYVEKAKPYDEAQEYCEKEYGTDLATILTPYDRYIAYKAIPMFEEGVWFGMNSKDGNNYWQYTGGDNLMDEYEKSGLCVNFWHNKPLCTNLKCGYECAYYKHGAAFNDADCQKPRAFLCDAVKQRFGKKAEDKDYFGPDMDCLCKGQAADGDGNKIEVRCDPIPNVPEDPYTHSVESCIKIDPKILPDCFLAGARIVDVSVQVQAQHGKVGDVSATLSKDGKEIKLWSADPGSCSRDDIDVKLKDDAAKGPWDPKKDCSQEETCHDDKYDTYVALCGEREPVNPFSNLAKESVEGIWKLTLLDECDEKYGIAAPGLPYPKEEYPKEEEPKEKDPKDPRRLGEEVMANKMGYSCSVVELREWTLKLTVEPFVSEYCECDSAKPVCEKGSDKKP